MTSAFRVAMVCGPPAAGHCGVWDYTTRLARGLRQGRLGTRSVDVEVIGGQGWGPAAATRIRRRAVEVGYDLIHLQYPARAYGYGLGPSLLPGALLGLGASPPLLVTLHEYEKVKRLRRLAALPLLLGADMVAVTNEPERAFLARRWPGRGADVRLVRLGSNLEEPRIFRTETDPPEALDGSNPPSAIGTAGPLRVGTFGIVRPDKGLPSLLEAFARIRQQVPEVRLVVIAEPVADPALSARIGALVGGLGLAEHLDWISAPTAEQAAAALAQLDVCVLPFTDGVSFRRGSFIAALRLGLPVVTTRPDRIPPGLADGRNVVLTPTSDTAALARAVTELLSDPLQRRRIGNEARALSGLFAWERGVAGYLDLYAELTGAAPGPRPGGGA